MLSSQFKWQLKPTFDSNQVKAIAQKLNVYPSIVEILFQRGYQSLDAINEFLHPNPQNLNDPFFIHDMEKGVERIQGAIQNGEKITVYGDYDADGVTSTSIMYEALNEIGGNVDYYIPNRFSEGYGPNEDAFNKIIQDGTSLIITVDNGIAGNNSIDLANKLGCDVIVTDHHELPDQIPAAYAIIHARYPGSRYPFGDLSGAGIAFKVATALLDEVPEDKLDLAAIGTIADLVSMTDENRIIAKYGLKAIQNTTRPGLIMLMKNADIPLDSMNEQSIGFGIAPRLNALGRMGDANTGVQLLTTLDSEQAQTLSKATETNNNKRKKLVDQITKLAIEQAQNDENRVKHTLVVAGKDWHEGVLGIVANRLVDKFHKPTIVLNLDDENNVAKGSGRSIEGFDIFKAMNNYRDQMISFGGHSMAIGLTIGKNQLNEVRDGFEQVSLKQGINDLKVPNLNVDSIIPIDDINDDFYHQLQLIGPFGIGNEQPNLEIKPSYISNINKMGKDQNHLRFSAHNQHSNINAVAFNKGDIASELLSTPNGIEIVGTLNLNTWRGKTNLQFMVSDILANGTKIIDKRTQYLTKSMFDSEAVYVFFHSKIFDLVRKYLNPNAKIILFNSLSANNSFDKIVVVDCPDQLDDLKYLLNYIKAKQMVLYLYTKHNIAKVGMPSRVQYAELFKFVQTHHNIDLENQLDTLAKYLNVTEGLLIFMLRLFKELNFISIDNGIMNGISNPKKQLLSSASIYQLRQNQIQTENQLLLKNTNDLIQFISNKLLTD